MAEPFDAGSYYDPNRNTYYSAGDVGRDWATLGPIFNGGAEERARAQEIAQRAASRLGSYVGTAPGPEQMRQFAPEDFLRFMDSPDFYLGQSQESQADPYAMGQQRRALEALMQMGSGMPTRGDIAGQQLARDQFAGEMAGQRGAIMQNMQQRGMAGGAQTAAMLSGLQGNQSALATQQAMLDQERGRRALGALGQAGGQAAQMQGQAMQRGQAADLFNQNNMDWRRKLGSYNQDIGNQNIGNRNEFNRFMAGELNNQWDRNYRAETSAANAAMGLSAMAERNGDRQADANREMVGQGISLLSVL